MLLSIRAAFSQERQNMLCCNLNFHQQIRVQFYCNMDTQQVQWLRYHLENRDSCKHVPLRDAMSRASSKTDLSPWWWIMSIFFKQNRNTLSIVWTRKAKYMFMCMCVYVCVHTCVMFLHVSSSFDWFNYRLTVSFPLSTQEKQTLRAHEKKSQMPTHTRTHTHAAHTYRSSSQSPCSLILCLPVICLSSSPLLDPLFSL